MSTQTAILKGEDITVDTKLSPEQINFAIDALRDQKPFIVKAILENANPDSRGFSEEPLSLVDLAEKFGAYLDSRSIGHLQDALYEGTKVLDILEVDDESVWEKALENR